MPKPKRPTPDSPDAGEGAAPRETWRLQRWMAHCGVASRRGCETLIRDGLVTVNGETVTDLGHQVTPGEDEVRVEGRRLRPRPVAVEEVWVACKPRGVTSTLSDAHAKMTLREVFPRVFNRANLRMIPIGRLDRDSEGVMLFASDGELAWRLSHPRYEVEKEYEVLLEGLIPVEVLKQWRDGVEIEALPEERRPTGPLLMRAEAYPVGFYRTPTGKIRSRLRSRLREGRKRQIRRMVEAAGAVVIRLRRVRVGPIRAKYLKPGDARRLTPEEIESLRRQVGLDAAPSAPPARASRRKRGSS